MPGQQNTREWIKTIISRVNDVVFYKGQALQWCKDNDVVSETITSKCVIAACIWVSTVRGEKITLGEIYDFLGIPEESYLAQDSDCNINDEVKFSPNVSSVELETLLQGILNDGV
jgi:hypothetical protein